MVFRFTSPSLLKKKPDGTEDDSDMVLKECPLSVVLNKAPHVFSAIQLHGMVNESGSINWFSLSPWAQQAIRVIGSEKQRLWEMGRKENQSQRDSQVGLEMRSNRG
jgi:hypothetical protein